MQPVKQRHPMVKRALTELWHLIDLAGKHNLGNAPVHIIAFTSSWAVGDQENFSFVGHESANISKRLHWPGLS